MSASLPLANGGAEAPCQCAAACRRPPNPCSARSAAAPPAGPTRRCLLSCLRPNRLAPPLLADYFSRVLSGTGAFASDNALASRTGLTRRVRALPGAPPGAACGSMLRQQAQGERSSRSLRALLALAGTRECTAAVIAPLPRPLPCALPAAVRPELCQQPYRLLQRIRRLLPAGAQLVICSALQAHGSAVWLAGLHGSWAPHRRPQALLLWAWQGRCCRTVLWALRR